MIKGNNTITREDGSSLAASEGDIIFYPKNTYYTSVWEDVNNAGQIVIKFIIEDSSGIQMSFGENISLLFNDKYVTYKPQFENILAVWNGGEIGFKIKCHSIFFEIFHNISQEMLKTVYRARHSSIYKAVLWIENNYLEEFSPEKLARMCNMCGSNFRRLFTMQLGMSPCRYRNTLRMKKSFELISSGNYTVSEVASLMNFNDISYFNKMFNRHFGCNPSSVKSSI